MRRLLLAIGLAVIVALGTASPAYAQIAAAIGKPLSSPDLPPGTVTVRVVAGSPANPVVGTTVTMVVNGTPREARTDDAGRATFSGLPVGATVQATVLDEDKKEVKSDEFQVADGNGARLMLTTKPWQGGGGGGAPFAGGGGGMPEPRQMSGEARGEQQDPPGQITVRVTYDDFKDTPEGVPVILVGYVSDDSTTYQVVKTDKAGRALFTGLDRSGNTSYFAMTLLQRNGGVDRLTSAPAVLESQVGVRMILSSEKRSSTSPAIDDLAKLDPQVATPAGKVRVGLEGVGDLTAQVTLVDAQSKKVIGTAAPQVSAPDPSRVQGGASFEVDPKLPAGTLDVDVKGGPGQTEEPLKDIEVKIIPAAAKTAEGAVTSLTGNDGTVRMALQLSGQLKAVFTINGRELASQPFELGKQGGKLNIRAHWDDTGRPEALFDLTPSENQAVYAECTYKNQHFRSLPFMPLAATGTKISVYVYPRVLFRFQLQSVVEDNLFAVQGRFEVSNYAWAPYRAGPDGLVIKMPAGFKGGVVFDEQSEVSVAPGEGFRIVRPIPPGGRQFHGGFSLPVENGTVKWALDLPYGTYQSDLVIRQTPGMVVHTPPSVTGETRTTAEGTFYLLGNISIFQNQSMVMSIEGLPSSPAWRTWVPRIIGVLVVAVMLAGIFFALKRPTIAPTAAPAAEARRKKLLDELVALERDGGDPKRKEQLLTELEQLWT